MKILVSLLSLAFVVGCTSTSNIKSEKDTFHGGMNHSSDQIGLVDGDFDVVFEKVEIPAKPATYNIKVVRSYESDVPYHANFGGKDSLLILADGKQYTFSTDDRSAQSAVRTVGWIAAMNIESATYRNIPESTFAALANAKELKFRAVGATKNYNGTSSPVVLAAMKNLQNSKLAE